MKQYYYEKLEEATTKLALLRVGYEREMKMLASELANSVESMHPLIIEKITKIRHALDAMIEEAKDYKAKYQAECDKEAGVC